MGLAAFFPLSFLTTPYVLVLMVGYPLALLCLVLRALYRTAWLRRTRRAVELGGACAPGGFRLFHRVNIALVLLLALLFLHGAWYAGASGVLSGLYSIRYLLLASLIVWWMRERSYTDRSIVNALLLLLGAALLIGFLRASWTPKLVEIEPEYWYTDEEGVIYGIYDDPVPLTLADFDVDVGEYPVSTAVMSASRSPLASRQKCHVYSPAGGDGAPHLYYTVIRTISPALAELCLRDPDLLDESLVPVDDDGWQAQAVWVGGTGQTLLVRWETAILSLSFNDALTLTRQQKDAIRQTVLTAVA